MIIRNIITKFIYIALCVEAAIFFLSVFFFLFVASLLIKNSLAPNTNIYAGVLMHLGQNWKKGMKEKKNNVPLCHQAVSNHIKLCIHF